MCKVDKSTTIEPKRARMTICQESNRVQRISIRKSCSLLTGKALRAIPTRMHLLLLSWLRLILAVQLVLALVPPSLGNKSIHEHIQPPPQPLVNGSQQEHQTISKQTS
ncbi:hypothetical protein I3760_03G144100 [Carya illinoinensis]|nr:hypothetical protein I3760_03G144100 [Carya illinoinensis]